MDCMSVAGFSDGHDSSGPGRPNAAGKASVTTRGPDPASRTRGPCALCSGIRGHDEGDVGDLLSL